jgi:hypothetical protein
LQDQRRFDFDNAVIADGGKLTPAGPVFDLVGHHFLAAPRCQDHVRGGLADEIRRNDPILSSMLKPQVWQHVFSAGDFN